jgi:protein TonB
MKYPEAAQQSNVQGKVIISFVIDTLGRASDHKVMKTVGGGCDQEALRTCQSIPNQWLAPRIGSKAVAVRYMMPFTFKMQQ